MGEGAFLTNLQEVADFYFNFPRRKLIVLEGVAKDLQVVVDIQINDAVNDLHTFFLATDH